MQLGVPWGLHVQERIEGIPFILGNARCQAKEHEMVIDTAVLPPPNNSLLALLVFRFHAGSLQFQLHLERC